MKLFWIERTISHTIVNFVGGGKIRFRNGCTGRRFCKYLRKYRHIFENIERVKSDNLYQNCIWQIWLQGEEDMPNIVRKCLESVKVFNKDKQIMLLSEENISDYIDIPEFIWKKYCNGQIPNAHFTDYLRLCLLAKYGGTWIDATVMLTDKIPYCIFSQDVFFFKNFKEEYRNLQNLKKNNLENFSPMVSNWFISAKPNNLFILTIKKFLEEYWNDENNLKHYFMFHFFVTYSVLCSSTLRNMWNNIFPLSNEFPHLLQNSFKTVYRDEVFDSCLKHSFIHKLTYRIDDDIDKRWIDKILNLKFEDLVKV